MEELLFKYFGFKEFKSHQKKIINNVIDGNNCIAILPTGYGKSLIYQMLSILLDGITLVITPLIALMEDQKYNLEKKNLKSCVINSNMDFKSLEKAYKQISNGEVKLVYVSAERLMNLRFNNMISKLKISLLVVDEAHTILWGKTFRESYSYLNDFISKVNNPLLLAVTATATNYTINLIKEGLGLNEFVLIKESVIKKNINYSVKMLKYKDRFLVNFLKDKNEKIIIYCLTRKCVERLYLLLESKGYNVCKYHGGLLSLEKENNQLNFKEGINNIIICTSAYGMGIDLPDIRYIIHYQIPKSMEDLVQQSGRVSRDGMIGYSLVLFNFDDLKIIRYFNEGLAKEVKKIEELKLNDLINFCLSKRCRHQLIGKYFNEKIKECNTMCDNCLKK